jgi:outer membrane protein OmpA-like peptidoglycan-associated protein
METNNLLILVVCVGLLGGCTTAARAAPKELVNAREAYQRASTGSAAQTAPAELRVAHQALAQAEQSFRENPDSYQTTRDLASVAQRKSEIAEATASRAIARRKQAQARNVYEATKGDSVTIMNRDLRQTRMGPDGSGSCGITTVEQIFAKYEVLTAAEERAIDALAALAELGTVKEESRGTVITLSGRSLFASNQAIFLIDMLTRLNRVSDALLATRERTLVVEGHSDSQGSVSDNFVLSLRRADAFRAYLIRRGYRADRIQSYGLGEGNPIADNASAEGRADNRRIEIIIEPELHASN